MVYDLEPRILGYLPRHFLEVFQIRIFDLFALNTDQMGVRRRIVSVIPIAAVTEAEFHDLPKLFGKRDCLVYGCEAGRGEVFFDLLIYGFSAGMLLAFSQDL